MAVKEALLGILTLGPAYGLQLHSELCARAPHRARINVGQIYGTLERLSIAELVLKTGVTPDGLPLYELTDHGRSAAETWLRGDTVFALTEWPELLDHVLVARSLSDATLESVVGVYEHILTADDPANERRSATHRVNLLTMADEHFTNAALAWLGDVRRDLSMRQSQAQTASVSQPDSPLSNDPHRRDSPSESVPYGYLTTRPKRGRPGLVK